MRSDPERDAEHSEKLRGVKAAKATSIFHWIFEREAVIVHSPNVTQPQPALTRVAFKKRGGKKRA